MTTRVLHLRTVTGKGGGPEKTILNSPGGIGDGYEMRLAYFRPKNDLQYDMPARARRIGVELVDIAESGPVDPRALASLLREIGSFRPHILHAHDYKTNLLALLVRRWSHAKIVSTMHGYGLPSSRLAMYYRLDAWTLPRMDYVVAVSAELQQTALRWGVRPAHCALVVNGIDTQAFCRRTNGDDIRAKLGIPRHVPLIGAVGRLHAEKGFDCLIRAVDSLISDGLNAHLVIAGEGEERGALTSLIGRLGRSEQIRLLGHRTDIADLLQCLDLFALSSLSEGLPNVLLEAMALNVPIVATRVGSVGEVIEDDINGVLIDPHNVESLKRALHRLLADHDLRQRLGDAGRLTVVEKFSFRKRMDKIRAIYGRLTKTDSKRPGAAASENRPAHRRKLVP
jgi:glycosyltransferase involved in cell wall biosynthesis